jgi:hypothetical protein
MKFKLFFTCILSCYLFQSCEDRINDIPVSENVLIPLSVGNYWVYIQKVNGFPQLTDTIKIAITGNTIIDYQSVDYSVWLWTKYRPGTNEPLDYSWLLWNGLDGLYNMGGISSTDTLIDKILFLKYPSYVGENWDVLTIGYHLTNNEFIITDTINYSCLATNELFQTPVGNFYCYVYYWREPLGDDIVDTLLHYTYYAPNLGYIGETIKTSLDSSVKFEIILNEYSINN